MILLSSSAGSRAPLRARPVCGVVDLLVIQAHRGGPLLHGSPSPGCVSRPPLSRAALGRPPVPCLVVQGGYFGVHVLANGGRGPPDDPPDHARRDARGARQARRRMTHRDEGAQASPCPGGVPAGGCVLHRGASDREQLLRLRGADASGDGACTDSELVAAAVTCDLAGWAGCDKIAVCVPSAAVPHHRSGLWLAGAARP